MHRLILATGFVLLISVPATAQQPVVLTLDQALERVRSSSPAVVAARMRIEEARARTAAASTPPTNPTLELHAGRRRGDGSSTDYEIAAAQDLELPARRQLRIDVASAGVELEEQRALQFEAERLREVAIAFLRALESRERATVATSAKELTTEALRIAERRFAAGDVAQLDVNLARTALARAEAGLRVADAAAAGAATRLQVLLGLPEPVTPAGSLRDPISSPRGEASLRAAARADVRVLEAEIGEAEAEHRFAHSLRWPDVGVRAAWEQEEGDRVITGGLGFSLPVFQRGREAAAVTSSRLARLRLERDALTRATETEVRGAIATHEAFRTAAELYERTVMPLIEENEKLALESYEVGQIGLGDLLLVRRESLDARSSLIDQLIETRLAEIELRTMSGVWK